ncbi:pyridoxal phosphate-dependent aminotransferase [Thermatribacter velox]|uniref:Aminotransferase n=1 Tax=Thermatribacter velox TaxID=3039681 RepID=A0ABZ2YB82_9BACT
MKKSGLDVISFSAGEPDFDTPLPIKEAAKRAIDQGFTKYTPTSGIPELKEAICEKLKRENDLHYTKEEIIVSCGAKHVLFNALMTLCDSNDEVLLPKPYWVTYYEQIVLAGGKPVLLDCDPETLLVPLEEVEKNISENTKLLILNNPSNPSGVVWSQEALEKIAQLCKKHNIFVISDEIYERLVYDGEKVKSIASLEGMKERALVVNGVSKAFSMTGWRIGYAAGPQEVIQAMGRLQDHSTSCPTSISQKAALAALRCDASVVEEMVTAFDQRRKAMMQYLSEIPGVRFPVPRGAFYIFADFSAYIGRKFETTTIDSSLTLADLLLEKAHLACVPGIAFGMEGFLRLSYATSLENIERGMARMQEFFKKLN